MRFDGALARSGGGTVTSTGSSSLASIAGTAEGAGAALGSAMRSIARSTSEARSPGLLPCSMILSSIPVGQIRSISSAITAFSLPEAAPTPS